MDTEKYKKMQKEYYEGTGIPPEAVVGNYAWHEEFPYETQLLYKNGDLRHPLFQNTHDKIALDFACGPGRMVPRMAKFFKRVDGVDISSRLIDEARASYPYSNFYVSSGDDMGEVPLNTYDFIFSTIALQHIAVHDIRMDIFRNIYDALKPGGQMTVQMGYNANFPFVEVGKKRQITLGDYRIKLIKKNVQHAAWSENKTDAASTNSACDVAINKADLPIIKKELGELFKNVSFWFYGVDVVYEDLNGAYHGPKYWPTHWIFLHGEK